MQNENIHKRGRYSAESKEKVALEALSGAKTHVRIAPEYGISSDLVKDRKKQARKVLGECFRRGGRKMRWRRRMSALPTLNDFWGRGSSSLIGCQKNKGVGTVAQRRQLLDKEGDVPSRKRQCDLLGLSRSSTYYKKRQTKEKAGVKKAIEKLYEEDATLGRRRMPVMLQRRYGIKIGEKKCERLKKQLGLRTLYPHRNTSVPTPRAGKGPYLLKDVEIKEVDQVWVSDITYIQIEQRNYYLCVVMDWDSRFVLGWSMGRKMDAGLCLQALEMALKSGRRPRIFNTDQGSQYSSEDWQSAIRAEGIQISMDGKGRWADNIVMERFWRTYKHEFFLQRGSGSLEEAMEMTAEWLEYYNKERLRCARAAEPALQNRAKNGLTSEVIG